MDDTPSNDPSALEESDFEKLLDAYSSGIGADLQVGDKISGDVIAIGADSVFVDTGTKIDGVVEKSELLDDDGNLPLQVGDSVTLYVVAVSEGEIRLAKALGGAGGAAVLEDAYNSRLPVEGTVVQTCKGGFQVEMAKCRAFCPFSQMDVRRVADPESYVGQTYHFRISRFESGGRNIVVSRRQLLAEAQQQAQEAFLADLTEGAVVKGTVTRLMPYGAFVELVPGIEGMVHISELSWSRIEEPGQVVGVGAAVEAKVIQIKCDDAKRPRIGLSLKQVSGDPWEQAGERFAEGQIVGGTVTRCVKFGAFVEIAPGIEGLVHLSEMSYTQRVTHAEAIVRPGESVSVMVKSVDAGKRRISLSLKEALGDPWQTVEEQFSVGQPVTGELVKRETFGHFIKLAPGITGLLPKSNIKQAADSAKLENLKPGSPIELVVSAIDVGARRLTLSTPDASGDDDWQQYAHRSQSQQTTPSPMGALGEKLQAALNKEKQKP